MVGLHTLRNRTRLLRGLWHWNRPSHDSTEPNDPHAMPFVCNVCGTDNRLPPARLTREDGPCRNCKCYGRLRALMLAVTGRFSPDELVLARMKPRKDIRGIGCSDWGYQTFGYSGLLAEKFDYVNTYYDQSPQLDLANVDWSRWPPESVDFITCTDVLEHVEPPLERTLENMRRLLKPGGAVILTVPTTLEPTTREHFPNLYRWELAGKDRQQMLLNRRRDGVIERFDTLCFHGGDGMTLEFRRFSRQGLLKSIEQAGFRSAAVLDYPIAEYGIPLAEDNFVLIAEKEA